MLFYWFSSWEKPDCDRCKSWTRIFLMYSNTSLPPPNKHTRLFWRSSDVYNVQETSNRRRNNVLCYFKQTNFCGQKLSRTRPYAIFFYLVDINFCGWEVQFFFCAHKLLRRANHEIFRVYKLSRIESLY